VTLYDYRQGCQYEVSLCILHRFVLLTKRVFRFVYIDTFVPSTSSKFIALGGIILVYFIFFNHVEILLLCKNERHSIFMPSCSAFALFFPVHIYVCIENSLVAM
jgi:hypothetical protein